MIKTVKITLKKTGEYLDSKYYTVSIKYWDNEIKTDHNILAFKIGDILIPIFMVLENYDDRIQVILKIENDEDSVNRLKHLTDQITVKSSKTKTRNELTSTKHESEYLRSFLIAHDLIVV